MFSLRLNTIEIKEPNPKFIIFVAETLNLSLLLPWVLIIPVSIFNGKLFLRLSKLPASIFYDRIS